MTRERINALSNEEEGLAHARPIMVNTVVNNVVIKTPPVTGRCRAMKPGDVISNKNMNETSFFTYYN